jgi:hypothetical protein
MRPARSVTVLLALSLAACVAPARSFKAYEDDAVQTAEAVLSAVETARLTAGTGARGEAFGPYVSVVIGEAEAEVSDARRLFESAQPPDARSDFLRRRLDPTLTQAVEVLSALRIAALRGELGRLAALARPLVPISRRLEGFLRLHL